MLPSESPRWDGHVMNATISQMDDPAAGWRDVVLQQALPLHDIGPLPASEVFFGAPRSEAAFGGEMGLVQGPSFRPDELQRIQELIKAQLVENARNVSPNAASAVADMPLDQYHRIADNHDHAKLLSKLGRILSARAVDEIKQMSFFDYVEEAFGPYYLSDEENIGHEQICFRVVRPDHRQDVGSLHCDSWFWDYYGFVIPEGMSRAKVWVPVCGSPDQAGLLLAPGSHRQCADYRTEKVDGKLAFLPEIDPQLVELRRFHGQPGDPIMFNYDVLHVGAMTRGEKCRVSFEITIMFRTQHA